LYNTAREFNGSFEVCIESSSGPDGMTTSPDKEFLKLAGDDGCSPLALIKIHTREKANIAT
jgi:hypothetical protein